MIDAVVYIGHGSRSCEGNAQFEKFIDSVKREIPILIQERAFLELTHPTIAETLEKIIAKGAERILIVPVLLFSAVHHKRDIPDEIRAIHQKYPNITWKMTDPFGIHPNMIKLVVKRIIAEINERDAAILLVGRGSSDPEPIQGLQEIGQAVEQVLNLPVYEAFLTGVGPSLDEVMQKLQSKYKKIYVMPYLLFTGVLLSKIERKVAIYKDGFQLCQNLKYDELMKLTLIERMKETCDGEFVSDHDEAKWKEGSHCRWRANCPA